jgi:histidinol phosphatase-like enzyme (inositol monophosphatase family)
MIEKTELKDLLDFAVQLAREAGALFLTHFKGSFSVERKADQSLVSAVDRELERLLRRRISEIFPDDSITGEEENERRGSSGRRWIIDPIDGTYSFVHGVPFYGVLIALEFQDEALLGVVNLPALDEIVYAARGWGCFWNCEPTRVSTVSSLNQALLLATDFGFSRNDEFSQVIRELEPRVEARRTWGDCYGHVLVATGRAEIMLDPLMGVSDCAPLLPIIEEAGGRFTDGKGRRTIYGKNAISTNGLLFDEVMKMIAKFPTHRSEN